jgi:hypothetical protein
MGNNQLVLQYKDLAQENARALQ